jgi:multiple sugar transport system permease protein
MDAWQTGNIMLIFLAGLKGIPQQYYEAAEIDGAGSFYKFTRITLPLLTPTIFFNLITGCINVMQIFVRAYIMTNGGPQDSTLFYVLYLYRNAFSYFQMGYASSLAWILFLIILTLTLIQVFLSRRWVHYEIV